MALNGLICADVPLSNYSLTHSLQCKDEEEMRAWMAKVSAASGASASAPRTQTLPIHADGSRSE